MLSTILDMAENYACMKLTSHCQCPFQVHYSYLTPLQDNELQSLTDVVHLQLPLDSIEIRGKHFSYGQLKFASLMDERQEESNVMGIQQRGDKNDVASACLNCD